MVSFHQKQNENVTIHIEADLDIYTFIVLARLGSVWHYYYYYYTPISVFVASFVNKFPIIIHTILQTFFLSLLNNNKHTYTQVEMIIQIYLIRMSTKKWVSYIKNLILPYHILVCISSFHFILYCLGFFLDYFNPDFIQGLTFLSQ